MKIIVPNLPGVAITTQGVSVDFTHKEVLLWIDMLAAYKEKYLVQPYVEPDVPHTPDPQINNLLNGIFKKNEK